MKIGFIGLGMMGSGMAANLQKAGHDLVVHDLRRAAAEPYLAAGAVWADYAARRRRSRRGGLHLTPGTSRGRGGGVGRERPALRA